MFFTDYLCYFIVCFHEICMFNSSKVFLNLYNSLLIFLIQSMFYYFLKPKKNSFVLIWQKYIFRLYATIVLELFHIFCFKRRYFMPYIQLCLLLSSGHNRLLFLLSTVLHTFYRQSKQIRPVKAFCHFGRVHFPRVNFFRENMKFSYLIFKCCKEKFEFIFRVV